MMPLCSPSLSLFVAEPPWASPRIPWLSHLQGSLATPTAISSSTTFNLKKIKHNIAKKKGTKLKSRLSKKKEISLELTDLRIGVARTLTLHAWLLVVFRMPSSRPVMHGLDVVVVGVLWQALPRMRLAESFESGFEQDVADGNQPSERTEKWYDSLVRKTLAVRVVRGAEEDVHVYMPEVLRGLCPWRSHYLPDIKSSC